MIAKEQKASGATDRRAPQPVAFAVARLVRINREHKLA